MKLLRYELKKLMVKPLYIGILLCVALLNLGVLYAQIHDRTDMESFAPPSYQKVYAALVDLPEEEKRPHLENVFMKASIAMLLEYRAAAQDPQLFETVREYRFSDCQAYIPHLTREQFDQAVQAAQTAWDQGVLPSYLADVHSDYYAARFILEECNAVDTYAEYLGGVQKQVSQMSGNTIFSKAETFSYRNAQKTGATYAKLAEVTPSYGPAKGIVTATDAGATDIMAVFLVALAAIWVFRPEKEEKLLFLIKPTTNGRARTLFVKLGAVFLASLLGEILLYTSRFLLCGVTFGFGSLTRALQSVPEYIASPFALSVGQFFLLYGLVKLLGLFLWGALVSCFCMALKSTTGVYLAAAGLAGGSAAANLLIGSSSGLALVKHVNLFNLIRVSPLYCSYLNLNLFRHPVNIWYLFGGLALFLFAGVLAGSVRLFSGERVLHSRSFDFSDKLAERNPFRRNASTQVVFHEYYKSFVLYKAALALAVFAVLQCFLYPSYKVPVSEDMLYYQSYLTTLSGPYTQEKHDYILAEQQRFDQLGAQMKAASQAFEKGEITKETYDHYRMGYQMQISEQQGLFLVQERERRILEGQAQGKEIWFTFDAGYNWLTGQNAGNDTLWALLSILMLIVCMVPIFAGEHDNHVLNMIRCTPNGREKTVWAKTAVALSMAVSIAAITYLPRLIFVGKRFGFSSLGAPAQSLEHLAQLPLSMNILQYLILTGCLRVLGLVLGTGAIFALATLTKNSIKALLAATVLLLLPLAIRMLNVMVLDCFTGNALFCANPLFAATDGKAPSMVGSILYLSICLLAGTLSFAYAYRKHTRTGSVWRLSTHGQ